jgi:hypothetical protein
MVLYPGTLLFALVICKRMHANQYFKAGEPLILSGETLLKVARDIPSICVKIYESNDTLPLPVSTDVNPDSNISCSDGSSLCKGGWHSISDSVEVCLAPYSACVNRSIPVAASCLILRLSAAQCHVSNHPTQAIVGLGKCGTSFLYWFGSHFVPSPSVKENCLASHSHALDWVSTSLRSTNWIGGCISPSFWLKLHTIAKPVDVNYFMAVRHVSTFAWAAFNYWNLPMDRLVQKPSMWARKDTNYRSNSLFHELMLSRGSVDFPGLLTWNMSSQAVELGMGFSSHTDFLSRNMTLFVLPSELFSSRMLMTAFASRLGLIATQCVNRTLVAQLVDRKVNSGTSEETKGAGMSSGKFKEGKYEISSYQPMLPSTCIHLSQSWVQNCERLNVLIRSSFARIGISPRRDPYQCQSFHYCM